MAGTKASPSQPPGAGDAPCARGETSFELVRRACAGDREAENAICARYLPRLQRWARGRLPRGARPALETGDVVQEVLMRAIRSFPSFAPQHERSFACYLRTILNNRLLDLGRMDQRRPPPSSLDSGADTTPSPDPSPLELAVGSEARERFDVAMRQLSPREQELIFMRLELCCDYDEMATMTGRSNPNAIRVATRRAMLRLAKFIAPGQGLR